MPNELLWFGMVILNFAFVLLMYRFGGMQGLLIWVPIAAITANIQVVKAIEVFGLQATLGNAVYATSFLVTDILSENYGKRVARKAVWYGFVSLVALVVLMNLALLFRPSDADFTHEHLVAIFTILPQITLASFAAFVVSQLHDVWAYAFWRRVFPGAHQIWLRNNLSTIVSQLIDSAIFTVAAFAGVFPAAVLIEIFISTYLLKVLVAAADTPLVYVAARWHRRGLVDSQLSIE